MGIERTDFWKWYKRMYEGPDGDFHGIPDWHKDDMFDCWCAALSYADKKGHPHVEEIYQDDYAEVSKERMDYALKRSEEKCKRPTCRALPTNGRV